MRTNRIKRRWRAIYFTAGQKCLSWGSWGNTRAPSEGRKCGVLPPSFPDLKINKRQVQRHKRKAAAPELSKIKSACTHPPTHPQRSESCQDTPLASKTHMRIPVQTRGAEQEWNNISIQSRYSLGFRWLRVLSKKRAQKGKFGLKLQTLGLLLKRKRRGRDCYNHTLKNNNKGGDRLSF